MWNALKSIFNRLRDKGDSDPVFEEVKGLVENLLAKDYSERSEREARDEEVVEVLERLDKEIDTIRERANGYPEGTIDAIVWLSGAGYANLCRKLTLHFREADWLLREENASALWAKATLAVCSHYRHLVGPAMLANADCQERLGNIDRARQMYRAVVTDFELVLDWDYSNGTLEEDERTAVESLRTAAERLIATGVSGEDGSRLAELRASADRLLA